MTEQNLAREKHVRQGSYAWSLEWFDLWLATAIGGIKFHNPNLIPTGKSV